MARNQHTSNQLGIFIHPNIKGWVLQLNYANGLNSFSWIKEKFNHKGTAFNSTTVFKLDYYFTRATQGIVLPYIMYLKITEQTENKMTYLFIPQYYSS